MPKKKFKIADLCKIRGVGSPLFSPNNGKHIVYGTSYADSSDHRPKDSVELFSLTDETKINIDNGTPHCWSPKGNEFLYETMEGELRVYNLGTKSSRFLIKPDHSAHFTDHLEKRNASWSPDGKYIAYLHADPVISKDGENVRVINSLLYKSKGGRGRAPFDDNRLTHIYIIPAWGGRPEILTDGPYNEHSITWSPDSTQIAFISNRTVNGDDNQYSDLWKVNIATKETTRLTNKFGTAFQPSWSPDGKHIAHLAVTGAMGTNDSPAKDTHIRLIPAVGGRSRYLTKSLDRRVENICWHPNGDLLYFTAGNHGVTSIYSVSLSSKEIEVIINKEGDIQEYSLHPNGGDFALICSYVNRPVELYHTMNQRTICNPVTNGNMVWAEQTTFMEAETFWFKSFDNTPVQSWLMKPTDFDPTKTYPLILVIHGGPHNMFGLGFDARMQLLSNAGYSVLYMNPRGSHGYGQNFSNGTLRDWGGGDYRDLMIGLDEILLRYKWVDRERLGVTGQSYGGYMTNWIITQTDRFKAAVSDGGICNLISFAGTSLYHSLMESEFQGLAHEKHDLLWKCSPIRNIARVRTPTLILHGETDNEVPLSQADEMYVALKKCKVETEYVQYVGEGHGWRPNLNCINQTDLNRRMIDWFDRFMAP